MADDGEGAESNGDGEGPSQLEELGRLIREQRERAQLSMRELAKRANISNPYLSQIERGLHEPSVRVLSSIASALELSAEALLRSAGLIGDPEGGPGTATTEMAIRVDTRLTEEQRQDLLTVYRAYVEQNRVE